jgi:SAM-dependent methyltransferase
MNTSPRSNFAVPACNIANRSLLDVGCGAGGFLRHCKNKCDYHLHGLDFAEDTCSEMVGLLGKHNYFYKTPIDLLDFGDKKFGVISMWGGVLEHLAQPLVNLRACRNILDFYGRVIILIPNLHSRAFNILGINVPTLNPREHTQFFTAQSFAHLCGASGFTVTAYFQELPVIDLMYENLQYDETLVEDILLHDEAYYHVYVLEMASA